jgi:hypothetical protein
MTGHNVPGVIDLVGRAVLKKSLVGFIVVFIEVKRFWEGNSTFLGRGREGLVGT